MSIVIDASTLLAWLLEDESSDLAEAAIARALDDGAMAPTILTYEFANGVRSAVRRRRLAKNATEDAHRRVAALDIQRIELSTSDLVITVTALALEHGLTTYDASYLFLALRERLPLATLDRRLQAAAEAAGCEVFG